MTTEAGSDERWPAYLSERATALLAAGGASNLEEPLGHRNPDNPNPNADLVPGPGGPIPFAPMIREVPRFMPLFPEFEFQAPERVDVNPRAFVPPQPPLLPRVVRP